MVNIRGHSLNGKTVKKTAKKGFVMCHVTPFGHFQPSVWPCSRGLFAFWPRTFTIELSEKKPTRTEIMILEGSVPLMSSSLSLSLSLSAEQCFPYGMQITSIQEAKETCDKKLNLNIKVMSTCVCMWACVRVFIYVCHNDILHMMCVCRCACVRVCAEKSLAHLTFRKLRDPARIATKHDCFHRSWPPGRSQSPPGSSSSELKITTDHEMPRT